MDDCHATIVISRGKKKPLCEVEKVKVPWKSADGAAKGKMEIKEISSSDLDEMKLASRSTSRSKRRRSRHLKMSSRPARRPSKLCLKPWWPR